MKGGGLSASGREAGATAPERCLVRGVWFLVFLPLLQTVLFPGMPGLNSDMARWGIEAFRVFRGEGLPLAGVVPYGGTVRIYAIALSYLIFGVNRLSLELPFAAMNSLTVLFVYLLVRRLFCVRAAAVCAAVLSASPWFVVRNIDNWYYFTSSLALLLLSCGRLPLSFLAGAVCGIACYEHQLAAVNCVAVLAAWGACGGWDRAAARGALAAAGGFLAGFLPRILCALLMRTGIHVEAFRGPAALLSAAWNFVPYFLGMVDGTVIYLRNAGSVAWRVLPVNSLFLGGATLLLLLRGRRLHRALLVYLAFAYLVPFLVVPYTAIRYFLNALFAASLVTGLGICELSRRSAPAAAAALVLFCGANCGYLAADFFLPFDRTGGECLLFRIGSLVEASHHLVRSDVLYDCLDKDVPAIVTPEPFIQTNLQFYDLGRGHFRSYSRSIEPGADRFYFIDYAGSKQGIVIDPARFPGYAVTRECAGLRNFTVYRFERKGPAVPPAP